jgi:hypothetical protein
MSKVVVKLLSSGFGRCDVAFMDAKFQICVHQYLKMDQSKYSAGRVVAMPSSSRYEM